MGKIVGRIALPATIHCTTEFLSDLGKEIAKAVGQEAKEFLDRDPGDKDAKQFWDVHHAKIAAMDAFRLTLEELTKPDDAKPIKLVIMVDELDRCRPDYALSLLEIIKHFFNVEGVHFVLGVNLSELQNIVRARYGSNIKAWKQH